MRSDKNRLIKRANDVIRDFQVFKMHKRSAPIFVNQFPVHVLNDMYSIVPVRNKKGDVMCGREYAETAKAIRSNSFYPVFKARSDGAALLETKVCRTTGDNHSPYVSGVLVNVNIDKISSKFHDVVTSRSIKVGQWIDVIRDPPPSFLETIVVAYEMVELGELYRTINGDFTNLPTHDTYYSDNIVHRESGAKFRPNARDNVRKEFKYRVSNRPNYRIVDDWEKRPLGPSTDSFFHSTGGGRYKSTLRTRRTVYETNNNEPKFHGHSDDDYAERNVDSDDDAEDGDDGDDDVSDEIRRYKYKRYYTESDHIMRALRNV